MKTLGEVIKEYRTTHCMSMDVFSDRSGISKSYISMLEKNKDGRGNPIAPSLETINKVAKCMGMSFNDLFNLLDPDQKITINTEPVVGKSSCFSHEEEQIIYAYRICSDDQKDMICRMLGVRRETSYSSTRIDTYSANSG